MALDFSRLVTDLSAWLNTFAILMLIYASSCGMERAPAPVRFLSESTFSIYLFHLFFVYSVQGVVANAQDLPGPAVVLVPWFAGLIGSLSLIFAGRYLLGRNSRAILGA